MCSIPTTKWCESRLVVGGQYVGDALSFRIATDIQYDFSRYCLLTQDYACGAEDVLAASPGRRVFLA